MSKEATTKQVAKLPILTSLEALRAVPEAVKMLWQASKKHFLITVGSRIAQGLIPAAMAYIGKQIIDHLSRAEGLTTRLWLLIGLEFALVIVAALLLYLGSYAQAALREYTQQHIGRDLNEQAAKLDLEFFEMPGNYDTFAKAQQEFARGPLLLTMALLLALQQFSVVFGFIGVVLVSYPLLVPVLLLAALPTLLVAKDSGFMSFQSHDLTTPEGRRAAYLDDLLSEDTSAKELRLYQLAPKFLRDSFAYTQNVLQVRLGVELSKAKKFAFADVFAATVQYGALMFILIQAAQQRITIGDFVLLSAALQSVRRNLSGGFASLGAVLENSLFFSDLTQFLSLEPKIVTPTQPKFVPSPIKRGLKIENLSFAYPGADKAVFTNLTFELRAHEATALVGVNGAGKTTLVKLLTRLYDPQAGRITLDGTDIRDFSPDAYRQCFGVILQDFVKYQLSARENIELGRGADEPSKERLECAARNAQVEDLVRGLPEGWETLLGRQFHVRGQDLSTGQWQRIALARALYRDAPMLILDEPTAALDAETEAELFEAYRNLTKGKLSLLITHRFNTVRFVDRIIVLEHGGILEDGTHGELMQKHGRYFEMFSAQAKAYDMQ
jgi:ATP-binding cassette, subfamily B, bacterial